MAKISEYKDRMTAPIGAVRTNPKTGKPIKSKQTVRKPAQKRK